MAVNKHILASPVTIDVSWEQKASSKDKLDLTAFLLNDNGQISDFSDMVFYGTTEVVDMKLTSTKHHITIETKHNKAKQITSQCMTIDLDSLSEDIKHIVFVVSCEDEKPLDKFQKAQIAFKDRHNHENVFRIEDNGDNVFCVSVGDIQKKNELWTLVEEATCYAGGLEKAYEDFVPKEIRKEQLPLSEIERPIISLGKGTMPKKNESKDTTKQSSDDGQSKNVINQRKNDIGRSDSGIKKHGGLMPRAIGHKKSEKTKEPAKSTSITKPDEDVTPKSGHGVMPRTPKVKTKNNETKEQPNSGESLSVNKTPVKTNKATRMANRFANKKNKQNK